MVQFARAPKELQLSTTLNTSTVLRTSAVSAAVLQAKEAAVAGAAVGHELGPFFGLPSTVLELLHKHRGINGLYDWQSECINKGLRGNNLLVSLPTSGGKTLVAEMLMLRALLVRKKHAIFLLPYVAIVQEKIVAMSATLSNLDQLGQFLGAELYTGNFRPVKLRQFVKLNDTISEINPAALTDEELLFNHRTVDYGVVVRSDVVSHYVIRTQPSDAAVSTVECAALALAALEGRPHIYTALVRPLTALCQHQLSHGAVVHESKERRYRLAPVPCLGKRTAKTLAQCGAHVAALGAGLADGAKGGRDGCIGEDDRAKGGNDWAKDVDDGCRDMNDESKGVDDRCIGADDRAKGGNDGALMGSYLADGAKGADDGWRDMDDGAKSGNAGAEGADDRCRNIDDRSKCVDDGHTFISDSGEAPEDDVGNDVTQSDAVCGEPASCQIPQTCISPMNERENNRFKGSGDSACNVNPIMSAEKPEDVQNVLHVDMSLTMSKNQTELFRGTSDEPSDLLEKSQDGACRR
ncbi:hypothetical protein HAZT_HAZT007355 [Hyalella azteca]|uniref:tRNA-uridine aminocarboxypropyltransferase n=1 Tax=Hyalella azteca TaxID=294128 RepID=A0A6A0H9Y8_HYAAZ|nr:hypothetical protein HAZT_HAZT007355 [Hyalella azteca]